MMEPELTEQGWRFGDHLGSGHDRLNGVTYVHEIYTRWPAAGSMDTEFSLNGPSARTP